MTDDDTTDRLDRLESLVERQAETIEALRDEVAELGGDRDCGSDSDAPVSRRTALRAGGLLALLGIGVGTASADPQGQVGTASDPLHALYSLEANSPSSLSVSTGGQRALDLDVPASDDVGNTAGGNVVAGHSTNVVEDGAAGVAIGGGGSDDPAGFNRVYDHYGTVTGGEGNQAGSDDGDPSTATHAVVGGDSNVANGPWSVVSGGQLSQASGESATVGGGNGNAAGGTESTVGGGRFNEASDTHATVSGGSSNTANAQRATVGGGNNNTASGLNATAGGGESNTASGNFATVGGGEDNTASEIQAIVGGGFDNTASEPVTTVGGGFDNTASDFFATVGGGNGNTASGRNATVVGGRSNEASGRASFAAGRNAKTETAGGTAHDGAFVWGDSSSEDVRSDADDQVVFQANGGMKVYTASDTSMDTGAELPPGSTSWAALSTRTAKSDIEAVEPAEVLERVESLEVATWRYDAEDEAVRHMGPIAEDFEDAFGLGHDADRISTVDADGVALAAIQGLAGKLDEKEGRIDDLANDTEDLRAENDRLRERNAELEARLDRVEANLGLDADSRRGVADD